MRNRSRACCSAKPDPSASSSSMRTSRSRTDTNTPSAYSTSSCGPGFTESSAALDRGAVERLVGDVEQPALLGAIAAAHGDALRLLRRRGVERPRRGRLPVDDERVVLVVVDPAAADVERPRRPVERQPAEDEPPLG